MHNMLKEFYNYLAKRTFDYFISYPVKLGDKYILNLDTDEQVNGFFKALCCLLENNHSKLKYSRMDEEPYETISFMTGMDKSVKLVVIQEIDI